MFSLTFKVYVSNFCMISSTTYLLSLFLLVIAGLVYSTSRWKWHPFFSLLIFSLILALGLGMSLADFPAIWATGFGTIIGQIGVIIFFGSILGLIMEYSGASKSLAWHLLHGLPARYLHLGFSHLGLIVGVPVFCDAGFLVLAPIAAEKSKNAFLRKEAVFGSLAGGLYLSHTLIPPTPGPLAVLGNFNASHLISWTILSGFVFSLLSLWLANFFWYFFKNPDFKQHEEKQTGREVHLPGFMASLLPVFLPIVLIASGLIAPIFSLPEILADGIAWLGHPITALGLSILLSWWFLKKHIPSGNQPIKKAMESAAPIIFLTGAGGAFGYIVRQSEMVMASIQSLQLDIGKPHWLLAGFFLNAFLKTLQGSSTAALIISSSFMLPLFPLGFEQDTLFVCHLLAAMGFGAMLVSHTNDSYFWVVNQLSGLEIKQSLLSFSLYTLVLGLCGIGIVLLSYLLFSL